MTRTLPRVLVRAMYVVLLLTLFTQSYWRGVTAEDIRKQVETPDEGQLFLWYDWADEAKWLNESNGGYDQSKVMQRFQQDLGRNMATRAWILTSALRAGLIGSKDIPTYEQKSTLPRMLSPHLDNQPFLNLPSDYFEIVSIATSAGQTAEQAAEQSDAQNAQNLKLIERLKATWANLESESFSSFGRLKSAVLLTELFNLVDAQANIDQRQNDVHRWLLQHQVVRQALFQQAGGFKLYDQTNHCDRRATLAALNLMQAYGVPPELDMGLLRAYLRPNFLYDFHPYDYVPKTVARTILNQLTDVPQPSVWNT